MIRLPLFSKVKTRTYFDDTVPPVVPPPPPPPPVTFTQEQVNKMLADNKRALQTQNTELVKQLEEIRATATLTVQQKEELDTRIQTLTQQHLTKEQQIAAELDKTNKKYKTDTEVLGNEAKKWRSSFDSVLVNNAIIEGASKHKAASPKQMQALLSAKAKVVEEVDDKGQATGNFVVKLPMAVIDPKTKVAVVVDLNMDEAIAKMREDPENANLFLNGDGKSGLGGSNVGQGGKSGPIDFKNMTPAEYQKWRTDNGYARK